MSSCLTKFGGNTYTFWGNNPCLTHCGLVIPYGSIELVQHWLRQWLLVWSDTTKPLPESMLTYHQGGQLTITWGQFPLPEPMNLLKIWFEFPRTNELIDGPCSGIPFLSSLSAMYLSTQPEAGHNERGQKWRHITLAWGMAGLYNNGDILAWGVAGLYNNGEILAWGMAGLYNNGDTLAWGMTGLHNNGDILAWGMAGLYNNGDILAWGMAGLYNNGDTLAWGMTGLHNNGDTLAWGMAGLHNNGDVLVWGMAGLYNNGDTLAWGMAGLYNNGDILAWGMAGLYNNGDILAWGMAGLYNNGLLCVRENWRIAL